MTSGKEFLEFEQNPYNPESKGPEEIVRLFYINNVPILPVVSKRGILLGILSKENVISELSDIERVGKQKIDTFVMKLLKKITLDDLLPVAGNVKEFPVINLFGEVYGKWSRLELFSACEKSGKAGQGSDQEAMKHRDEQILEFMIYLVLEHIPAALYALNDKGRTIFFNSHFENIISKNDGKEVDPKFVEASLSDAKRNDFFYKKKDNKKDIYFYNKDMNFYYEKIPMVSNNKNVGYLIFVDKSLGENKTSVIPGPEMNGMSFNEMIESAERAIIVDSLNQNANNIKETAKALKLTARALEGKIEKHGIKL